MSKWSLITAMLMMAVGCGRVAETGTAGTSTNSKDVRLPVKAPKEEREGSRPTPTAKAASGKRDKKVEPVIEPKVQPWLMTSVDLSEIYTNPVRGKLWDRQPITMLATVTKINPSYLYCLGAPGRPIGDIRLYWSEPSGFDRLAEWDRIIIKGEIEGRGILGATVVKRAVLLDREPSEADRLIPKFRGEMAQSGEYRVFSGQHAP